MTRNRLVVRIGLAAVAVAAVAAVAVTGGAPPAETAPGIGVAPSDGADPRAGVAEAALVKLDPISRDVALSLEPGEWGQAALETTDGRLIVGLGRGRELDAVVSGSSPVVVGLKGPIEEILAVIGHPSTSRASLGEDIRAMRPVAAPLAAAAAIPAPGQPYLAVPLSIDLQVREIPADRRGSMLVSLARLIVTIDGQPYQSLHLEEWCNADVPVMCGFEATGAVARSGGQSDVWRVTATAASGWNAIGGPDDRPSLNGVPRWLAREAERIARSDPAIAAVIATYQTIDGTTWHPNAPQMIAVRYSRACASHAFRLAAAGDGVLADHGECFDHLELQVDVGEQLVVGQAVWSDSDGAFRPWR